MNINTTTTTAYVVPVSDDTVVVQSNVSQSSVMVVDSPDVVLSITPDASIVVNASEVTTHVIETAAEQGPRGASGVTVFPAGEVLSGDMVVVLTSAGTLTRADCSTVAHAGAVVGLTKTASVAAGLVELVTGGVVTSLGWNFTPGDYIVLGNNGQPTQQLPLNAAFTQGLGKALTPTSFLLNIGQPILNN